MHRMAFPDLSAFRPERLLFAPMPRSDEPELMDAPILDEAELAANLRDIRRVNRLLGGTAVVLHHLPRIVVAISPARPITLLDLATGSGDSPLAVSRWAKRHGLALTITASDYSEAILAAARTQLAAHPKITLARYDARSVPLPDKSVDVVLCSLSLHHFPPDDAVRVLLEMNRIARHGFILNDLRRGRLGYAAAWIAAHGTTRNRLTRNDAPLSIRRAYTPAELDELLHRAGIDDAEITTHPWFRMAAVKVTANSHG
jgi:ubiquinone/menaquinone biosynthesis C-methylase UbiE